MLGQTAGDLELIVIDDGSRDGDRRPPRRHRAIRACASSAEPPAGLTASLNRALALARAPLVARLDADDLALPERLARQRAFLAAHPDVGLLGAGRARGGRGRPRGRGAPAAHRRRRPPRRPHPAQPLHPLGGDGPARARGARGRLRRVRAGGAGLRPLDAAGAADPPGEPARGARRPPSPARSRLRRCGTTRAFGRRRASAGARCGAGAIRGGARCSRCVRPPPSRCRCPFAAACGDALGR